MFDDTAVARLRRDVCSDMKSCKGDLGVCRQSTTMACYLSGGYWGDGGSVFLCTSFVHVDDVCSSLGV